MTMPKISLIVLVLWLFFTLGCERNEIHEELAQGAGLASPSATPVVHAFAKEWNSPTLDLRVFRSDTVVRVKPLTSVLGKVETVPSAPGVAPTYRASVEFSFEVTEYLKGNGKKDLVVEIEQGHTFLTREDAQSLVNYMLNDRNTSWDSREAVLFLSLPSGQAAQTNATKSYEKCNQCSNGLAEIASSTTNSASRYGFMKWGYEYTDFQLDGNAKTWLPAKETKASAEAAGVSTPILFLADSEPTQPGGTLPTISLSEIRSSITEITAKLERGKGIEGYEYCLYNSLVNISEMRGQYLSAIDRRLNSGLPAGSVVGKTDEYWFAGNGYGKWWLSGRDSSLFSRKVVDFEGRPLTDELFKDYIVYRVPITSARPLPAGVYEFYEQYQLPEFIPCGFIYPDEKRSITKVTVNPPVGTVHEAFFDPVNLTGGAVGADKDNGALKPTSFTVNGAATKIERVKWDPSGKVSVELKPGVSLKGHLIEFIGLNGKPFLSLSFDRSGGTSSAPSWQVCDPPWKAGDLLMIRISAGATAFGEAAKVSPCPNAPTPTPTPKTPARGRG